MIEGVEKYPKANQSVLQKAKYESKKFECTKQNPKILKHLKDKKISKFLINLQKILLSKGLAAVLEA